MKRILKWSGLTLLGLMIVGAALLAHTWFFRPVSIDWFYTRVFLQFALDSPDLLTQLRLLEPLGLRSHNGRLDDASAAHQDMLVARLADDYAALHRYDASRYTWQDRLSYDIFDYFVGVQVRGARWRYHNYPVNQLFGVQSNLPNLMTQQQQVSDATDAELYIARLGKATRNDGAWALPDGEAFYQFAIESNTTTTMTADQIHALGLAEVARVNAEMDRLLVAAGYTDGTVGERMRALGKSPAQLYPDTDEGRAQILADYETIIREMAAGLAPLFGTKPKASVVVKRIPPFTEKSAAARWPITRRCPGTTCRWRSRRRSRGCRSSAA